MLPYASDTPLKRPPMVTILLMIVNTTIGIAMILLPGGSIISKYGLQPQHLSWINLFTYQFMHTSPDHLIINMAYIWVFGAGVEEAIGSKMMLLLYLIGGIVGGVLQSLVSDAFLHSGMTYPIVGASASCAALIGLFAVRYYRARLSFTMIPFRPHVVTVLSIFLTYEIGSGLWDLSQGAYGGSVAHWAHIGGFVTGMTFGHLLHMEKEGQKAYLTSDAENAITQSKPGEALRRWERLLLLQPENIDAMVELARAWYLLEDTEQAGEFYSIALHKALETSRMEQATKIYTELRKYNITIEEISPIGWLHLAGGLEEVKQFDLAEDVLTHIYLNFPGSSEAEKALLRAAAISFQPLGRLDEAFSKLNLYLHLYPHSAWKGFAEEMLRKISSQ